MPPKKADKSAIPASRTWRRTVEGVVANDRMEKTITVRVERLARDARFGKTLRKFYVCYAHDEKREAKRGDKVELMETRPMSKLKRWRVIRVISRASVVLEQDARDAARPASGAEPATAP